MCFLLSLAAGSPSGWLLQTIWYRQTTGKRSTIAKIYPKVKPIGFCLGQRDLRATIYACFAKGLSDHRAERNEAGRTRQKRPYQAGVATIGPHHRPSSPSYLPWPNNNRDPYSLLSRSLKKGDKNPDTLHTQLKTKRN